MVTKKQLTEMLVNQYDLPESIRFDVIEAISKFSDKLILSEARRAGLDICRLRAGQFLINTKLS